MAIIWKTIPGYEGLYEASNTGMVRSLKRNTTSGKVLSPGVTHGGYLLVTLVKNGKHKSHPLHRLIVMAFTGENLKGKQINHLNFVVTDNRIENLEICSPQENMAHYYQKKNDGRLKLSREKIDQIIDLVTNKGLIQEKVAKMFDCHQADVSNFVNKKRRIYQY